MRDRQLLVLPLSHYWKSCGSVLPARVERAHSEGRLFKQRLFFLNQLRRGWLGALHLRASCPPAHPGAPRRAHNPSEHCLNRVLSSKENFPSLLVFMQDGWAAGASIKGIFCPAVAEPFAYSLPPQSLPVSQRP